MEIIVKSDGELLDYLVNNIDMPRKKIKEYLTHGSIYVNNNRTTKYNYPVYSGNTIIIDTKSKNKVILPFEILFEDEHIIVVNKPSGLLTIATDNEKYNTLYHIVRNYLVSKNKNNRIFIVHRLDKDTSGVIIFAKDERTKNMLQDNWNDYVKLREYICVVHGKLEEKDKKIVNYFFKTNGKDTFIEIIYKDIDKLNSIKMICDKKKIKLNEVVSVGGNSNDLNLISNTIGNCVKNGEKEVKKAAKYVTKLDRSLGVNEVILKYFEV